MNENFVKQKLQKFTKFFITKMFCDMYCSVLCSSSFVQALSQCRYDRHALPGLRSKFTSSVLGKLTHMLMRGRRKTGEEVMAGEREREREKLEALAMVNIKCEIYDIISELHWHVG